MRILLTNDDGIDSDGLHVLARAMRAHGKVVIAAPDEEYSGASAAIGALHLMEPTIERRQIDGIDEAWAVNGAPALCVMFSRLGVFGEPFDLVVSGINPGANVGRSVYHSGTVGAAVTARIGGTHGVAVSQAVTNWGVEGQSWESMIADQRWETAAHVASVAVGGLIASPPTEPSVLNINVPNVEIDELRGWRYAEVAKMPTRAISNATLIAIDGPGESYSVKLSWGDKIDLPVETDTGAVEVDQVAVTWLSRVAHEDIVGHESTTAALAAAFGDPHSA